MLFSYSHEGGQSVWGEMLFKDTLWSYKDVVPSRRSKLTPLENFIALVRAFFFLFCFGVFFFASSR